ncbi:MAG: LysR family transcriptional regulator [Ruminococcaceae bacterium]|nr:LysR family transcriptional regulator [Oscillospiraceae bacterium]
MDSKLKTFLTLCQTMNYRLAAERLHLSQPAVTKQIQSLEQSFGTKLFLYDGHTLQKTEKCLLLERYAISIQYQFEELQLAIAEKERLKLRIGATKTIGDYVLIDAIKDYLSYPNRELSLVVDNTRHLLQMLDENKLDFAVIEGTFSKSKYDSYLYRMEPFVGVCAKNSPLCGKHIPVEELLNETIIVREEGSGTRRIFEERLISSGYELNDFYRQVSISSFVSIKALVSAGIGISFLYQSVVAGDDNIGVFTVDGLTEPHAFHVVYTRNTRAKRYSQQFLEGGLLKKFSELQE